MPKDRSQTLQTAFMATMKDADFLAEAKKANLVVSPLDGPTIEQTVAELYRAEPKLLERFRNIIAKPNAIEAEQACIRAFGAVEVARRRRWVRPHPSLRMRRKSPAIPGQVGR